MVPLEDKEQPKEGEQPPVKCSRGSVDVHVKVSVLKAVLWCPGFNILKSQFAKPYLICCFCRCCNRSPSMSLLRSS